MGKIKTYYSIFRRMIIDGGKTLIPPMDVSPSQTGSLMTDNKPDIKAVFKEKQKVNARETKPNSDKNLIVRKILNRT